jgi:hypothetical protein
MRFSLFFVTIGFFIRYREAIESALMDPSRKTFFFFFFFFFIGNKKILLKQS